MCHSTTNWITSPRKAHHLFNHKSIYFGCRATNFTLMILIAKMKKRAGRGENGATFAHLPQDWWIEGFSKKFCNAVVALWCYLVKLKDCSCSRAFHHWFIPTLAFLNRLEELSEVKGKMKMLFALKDWTWELLRKSTPKKHGAFRPSCLPASAQLLDSSILRQSIDRWWW